MGTFALVSILISKPITEQCQGKTDATVTDDFNDQEALPDGDIVSASEVIDDECAMRVCATICFLTGSIMLGLGVLRLGALNAFLTDPLVSGFTTGAGLHVFTSQVRNSWSKKFECHNKKIVLFLDKVHFGSQCQTPRRSRSACDDLL